MRFIDQYLKGNEAFVARVEDWIDLVEKRKHVIVTPFFSEDESQLFEYIIGNRIPYIKSGGYENAQRVRYILKAYEDDEIDDKIVILCAHYQPKYGLIKHSDVLGAIMNLGLEREKIGDLLIMDQKILIMIDAELENYIICNLTKIKRSNVHFQKYEGSIDYQVNIQYMQKIISNTRLDVLVSGICNISRSKAQGLIKAGYVKVNHIVLDETSFLCYNNSVISIRGYGRFIFKEVIKKTKNDHLVVEIGKYQ